MGDPGDLVYGNRFLAFAPLVLFALAAGGCMVSRSTYDIKTREADSLRNALAAINKEKGALEAKHAALLKQLADEKDVTSSQASRLRAQEEEIRRMNEELASARKNYEGTRITREQFISELLEKEKATGKRIQELSARAQSCETGLENLRREGGARESELAQMRKQVEQSREDENARRERDILLGRQERMAEELKQEEKRRENLFSLLSEAIAKASPAVPVTSLGPALRVYLPENVFLGKGRRGLSEGGRKVVLEVGKAAAENPAASVFLAAGVTERAEAIRGLLINGAKVPKERIVVKSLAKEKGAELLLLIP